jgi:small subunit ribosomal protein S17
VSTEEPVTGEVTDDTQPAPAAAPDRSTGDTATGERQRASGEAATSTARQRAARKVREGVVVSNGMDKTAVVAVVERVRHPKYNKTVLQTKKLHAHDETNDVNVGDRVRVMETRPLSKQKRWRITDVLERAK